MIHPTADVSPNAIIGEGTRIWNNAQVREGVVIGAGCSLGKDVYIDAGVRIGNRVKIQNGVSVYKGVTLEDDVFLGPHSSFTNDIRPRAFSEDWQIIPTLLKRGSSVGANATILCGITLGEFSMISAGAVVVENTLAHGLYLGNPARLKGFVGKKGFDLGTVYHRDGDIFFHSPDTGETLRVSISLIEEK